MLFFASCILNPKLTEKIAERLRPWLLEILGCAKKLVGSPSDLDKKVHLAFCVCLSKLLVYGNEINKLVILCYGSLCIAVDTLGVKCN